MPENIKKQPYNVSGQLSPKNITKLNLAHLKLKLQLELRLVLLLFYPTTHPPTTHYPPPNHPPGLVVEKIYIE